jgi:hypothetical protein
MKRKRRATTSYEKATARKTGTSVRRLRKEQAAAESLEALAKARSKYKEQGDPSSCGDEVAQALKEAFTTADGDFDLDGFKRCLKNNDVQAPKVDELNPAGAVDLGCAQESHFAQRCEKPGRSLLATGR